MIAMALLHLPLGDYERRLYQAQAGEEVQGLPLLSTKSSVFDAFSVPRVKSTRVY